MIEINDRLWFRGVFVVLSTGIKILWVLFLSRSLAQRKGGLVFYGSRLVLADQATENKNGDSKGEAKEDCFSDSKGKAKEDCFSDSKGEAKEESTST